MNKENMIRVIKGQDEIQSFRCRVLKWHRWTTWQILEVDWERGPTEPKMRCYCADCGLARFESPYTRTLKR